MMDISQFKPVDFAAVAPPKRLEEIRLGEKIQQWEGSKIPEGSFVLLGVPDDRGVALSRGRVGAAGGPPAFRKEFYRLTLGVRGDLEKTAIWDVGDLKIAGTQEETYLGLREAVREILQQGAFPILIGGGHDLSYGSLSGFLDVYPDGGVLNVDPHFDCRLPEGEGGYSSGTAFRHLLEDGILKGPRLLEFGFQTQCNARPHFAYLKERRAHLISWDELSTIDIASRFRQVSEKIAQSCEALALTFDLDCMDVSQAPGVSAINPYGLMVPEALGLLRVAAENRKLKYLDLMELNPACDENHRTARLAALLVFSFLVHRSKF